MKNSSFSKLLRKEVVAVNTTLRKSVHRKVIKICTRSIWDQQREGVEIKMKPITKVFLVIAALVLCLVVWGLFFNDGGVLQTGWNAMIAPVNTTWQSITGDNSAKLLPTFADTKTGGETNSLNVDGNMGGN